MATSRRQHWSSVVTYVIRLPSLPLNASVFYFDTRILTISRLFAVTLSSSSNDFTVWAGSMFLYCSCIVHRTLYMLFSIFRHSWSIPKTILTVHVEHYVYTPSSAARYQPKHFFGDRMERSSRGDLQLLQDCHSIENASCVLWVFFSGYFSTVTRRSSCWESLVLLVFRGSP